MLVYLINNSVAIDASKVEFSKVQLIANYFKNASVKLIDVDHENDTAYHTFKFDEMQVVHVFEKENGFISDLGLFYSIGDWGNTLSHQVLDECDIIISASFEGFKGDFEISPIFVADDKVMQNQLAQDYEYFEDERNNDMYFFKSKNVRLEA